MYKEPCMCGAPDCIACRGSLALYIGACDDCSYIDDCLEEPSPNCKRISIDLEADIERILDERNKQW